MQLIKIGRVAAWILFVTIIIYFITGYGMTKGIIDRNFSLFLHETILPFITIVAFVIHASISIKFAFMRWRIWNLFTLFTLIIIFGGILLLFLYFQFFVQPNLLPNSNLRPLESSKNNSTNILNYGNSSQPKKTFNPAELAKYDGKNGSPAYVAVDGIVYDLSRVFINGDHSGYSAGQDLTNVFHSRHDSSILTKFPVVGFLK
jgi:predicted heme/steroid binding protein